MGCRFLEKFSRSHPVDEPTPSRSLGPSCARTWSWRSPRRPRPAATPPSLPTTAHWCADFFHPLPIFLPPSSSRCPWSICYKGSRYSRGLPELWLNTKDLGLCNDCPSVTALHSPTYSLPTGRWRKCGVEGVAAELGAIWHPQGVPRFAPEWDSDGPVTCFEEPLCLHLFFLCGGVRWSNKLPPNEKILCPII